MTAHESCSCRVELLYSRSEASSRRSLSPLPRIVRASTGTPNRLSRVYCSLGSFSFLTFALLIFLLKSIHVSSEEVRVGHLKLNDFFGADHCANFPLAIRCSDEAFIVCRFKGFCVAFSGNRFCPPIVFL